MSFAWGEVGDAGQNQLPASLLAAQKELECGQLSLENGDLQKALRQFQKAIGDVQHNVSAKGCQMRLSLHVLIGGVLLRVNQPKAAQDEFTSAVAIDSKCVKAIVHKAKALVALGKINEAQDELSRATALDPGDEEAASVLSVIRHCLDNDNNVASCIAFIEAGEYDQAVACLKKVVETAHTLGATRQVAHGCSYIGIVLQKKRESSAVEWHQRHNHLAEGLGDTEERCRALSNLSSAYTLASQPQKAIECQEAQLELVKETKTEKDLCRFYGNMSISYRAVRNFERAVECHQRSLQLAVDHRDAQLQCMCYHQLGKTYRAMGKLEFAANCHTEGVACARKTGLESDLCRELHELGCVLMTAGDNAQALAAFEEELAIISKYEDARVESANVTANIGLCRAALGQWEEAADCFDRHLQVATAQEDNEGQGQSNRNLEEVYRSMGEQDKALERGMANLQLALSANDMHEQAKAHGSIARTLSLMGDGKKAAESFRHALSTPTPDINPDS